MIETEQTDSVQREEGYAEPETPGYARDSANGYDNLFEHLLDELRWLNRVLAAQVLRLRKVNFYQDIKDFRGLFIADEEIDAILSSVMSPSNGDGQPANDSRLGTMEALASEMRRRINQRVKQSQRQNIVLPIVQLMHSFGLSDFEYCVLVICVASELDSTYGRLYAYLQDNRQKTSPGIELVLSLLSRSPQQRLENLAYLGMNSRLQYYFLLDAARGSNRSFGQDILCVNERVRNYILGRNSVDETLSAFLYFGAPVPWTSLVLNGQLKERLQALLNDTTRSEKEDRPTFYFYGAAGAGKKTLARALCIDIGVMLAVVDVRALLRSPDDFKVKVRLILREGMLQPCAVYFDHIESLALQSDQASDLWNKLVREIRDLGWIVFLGSSDPVPVGLIESFHFYPVEISKPGLREQQDLWRIHLGDLSSNGDLSELATVTSQFDLNPGQIARAVCLARQLALVRDPGAGKVGPQDIVLSSRLLVHSNLSNLAVKIESKFRWDDLVLPSDKKEQLAELISQVENKHKVLDSWGFADKLSLGSGLAVLFVGPSGTGKTMSAEVIANEVGLELYKVDLSSVVSKYIGETEKNLSHIFTEAERINAILFFDEADAILGKRSEVKDAHDRYANLEVAYLLQKMEEFNGIAILATNFRRNIDEAFTRRLRFIIEFPLPEKEDRLLIWQGIWPQGTPRSSDLDLDFMSSQFKFSGGNIRNVALTAAFYAAEENGAVTMTHLVLATKREYQKIGKLCGKTEFGKYYELVRER